MNEIIEFHAAVIRRAGRTQPRATPRNPFPVRAGFPGDLTFEITGGFGGLAGDARGYSLTFGYWVLGVCSGYCLVNCFAPFGRLFRNVW